MFGNKITQEQYEDVTKQLSNVQARNMRLEDNLKEAEETIENLASEKQALAEQINQHQSNLKQLKQTHAEQINKIKLGVNTQVNHQLATIGVGQFASEIYSVQPTNSDLELLIEFNGLTGGKKTEFWNVNKAAITRALLTN